MIDTIYANGCSWTAGDEIEKDSKFLKYLEQQGLEFNHKARSIHNKEGAHICHLTNIREKFNWPSKLAFKLNVPAVINESTGAGSNYRILRMTCDFILSVPAEKQENLLVLIGWTSPDRKEVHLQNKNSWERFNHSQPFSITVGRKDIFQKYELEQYDEYQKMHLTYMFSQYQNEKIYFQQVYLLANLLENLKIKYFFFNAFHTSFYLQPGRENLVIPYEFRNSINWYKSHNAILSNLTMSDYVSSNKLPVAEYKHPMIDAHDSWADFLIDLMKSRKII